MQKKIRILAIIIFIAFIIISLPNFFNLNNYKPEISKQIYNHTNYHLIIDGDIKLFFIPNLQIKLKDTKILKQLSDSDPLFKAEELQASLKILPLLRKRIEIDKITITHANLTQQLEGNKYIKLTNLDLSTKLDLAKTKINFTFENNGLEIQGNLILKSIDELINNKEYNNDFELKLKAFKQVNNLKSKTTVSESEMHGKLKYNKNENIHIEAKIKLNNTDLDILSAHNIYITKENNKGLFKKASYIKTSSSDSSKQNLNLDLHADIEATNTILSSTLIKEIISTINIAQDNINAKFNKISLYDGIVSGDINIGHYSSQHPNINADLKAYNIGINNFFTASKLLKSIKGKANLNLKLHTNSFDPKIFKSNLNGIGNLEIKGGEINNISPEFQTLFLTLSGKQVSNILFSSMTGDFNINHGILANDNLKIISDIAEFKGSGTININNDSINYTLTPIRIFDKSNKDEISLRIKNSLTNPKYSVDLNKILTNQVKEKLLNKFDPEGKRTKDIENSIGKILEMVR